MHKKYTDESILRFRTDLVKDETFRSDVLAYMYMDLNLTLLDPDVQKKLSEFVHIQEKVGGDLLTIINAVLHPGTLATSVCVTDLYLFLLKAKLHKKSIDVVSVVYPSYGNRDKFQIYDYGDSYAHLLALTHVIDIARYCNRLDNENLNNGRPRYTDNTDVTSNQIETAFRYIHDRLSHINADHFARMIDAFKIKIDTASAPTFVAACERLGITL